jgi:ribonuclease HI
MNTAKATFKIYSDGGARGNPGPAAIAFMVISQSGQLLRTGSRLIGIRTNNQAEYEALISALESANSFKASEVVSFLDSELVCKQLTGVYSVKNAELRVLWGRVQELKKCFTKVSFENVPRTEEHIQKVDKLVNSALDAKLK